MSKQFPADRPQKEFGKSPNMGPVYALAGKDRAAYDPRLDLGFLQGESDTAKTVHHLRKCR